MTAATVFYCYRIDVIAAGTEFAGYAGINLGEVHPDIDALDVAHSVDHAARYRECVDTVTHSLCTRSVDVCDGCVGEIDLQNKFRTEPNEFKLVGIQISKERSFYRLTDKIKLDIIPEQKPVTAQQKVEGVEKLVAFMKKFEEENK